jgi:hypothetical protein
MSRSDTAGLLCFGACIGRARDALTSRAVFPLTAPHFRNRLTGAHSPREALTAPIHATRHSGARIGHRPDIALSRQIRCHGEATSVLESATLDPQPPGGNRKAQLGAETPPVRPKRPRCCLHARSTSEMQSPKLPSDSARRWERRSRGVGCALRACRCPPGGGAKLFGLSRQQVSNIAKKRR